MSTNHKRLVEYLQANKINFDLLEHEPAGSVEDYHRVLDTDYREQAKALLLRYKKPSKKGYIVLTLQANKQANLLRAQRLLGAKSLRLAKVSELEEVTGCNYGELPPFGKFFGIELMMDSELLDQKRILFNAAKLDRSISIDPNSVRKLEDPIMY